MSFACRVARFSLVVGSCIAWLVLSTGSASAQTRHHITFGLGYAKLLSKDVKDDTTGVDFSNAGNGVLAYRYTLNPSFDLTLDSRGTASNQSLLGVDLWLLNSFFGPGVRWHPTAGAGVRPYVQANFFFVSEEIQADFGGAKVSSSESGTGFGLSGGVDIPMTHLLSLPVEVNYNYAKPADDVSSFGFTVSLAFNFGGTP